MAKFPPDENDMAKAYNTIAEAARFLDEVVFIGSSRVSEQLSKACPICGCSKDYGHSEKCELRKMVSESSLLGTDLRSALSTFGIMESILVEQRPEDVSEGV